MRASRRQLKPARTCVRPTRKKPACLFRPIPDVLVIPPDPPQMMIKVDQVRRVIETIYYRPGEAKERVYIFTESSFMKEAANSLLKVLEEPPEFATIFLLTENPGELLPTIRSRSMIVTLSALPAEEIEQDLAKHRPEWTAEAASAGGSPVEWRGWRGAKLRSGRLYRRAHPGLDHSQYRVARHRPQRTVQSD